MYIYVVGADMTSEDILSILHMTLGGDDGTDDRNMIRGVWEIYECM